MANRIVQSVFGCALLVTLLASAATAQVQRTFVSGGGSDSNPCSRTAPCRTFPQAISQTNPGGEVIILDSAGYAAFGINKSVSIIAPPGIYAGITVFSGNGIDIGTGGLTEVVVILRGLTINNQGSAGSGIVLNANAQTFPTLHIEGCVINGFGTTNGAAGGVLFQAPGDLEVKDSILRGNANGIVVDPPAFGNSCIATVDQVRLEGNGDGLLVRGSSTVTVSNSVASANQNGFSCSSNSSASPQLSVESCIASNNSAGILAVSTSTGVVTVRVSNCTVTDNGIGLDNAGAPAVILSRTNNTVEGNTIHDTFGTIGSYSAN